MNKNEMKMKMNTIINKYVENAEVVDELIKYVESAKIKYVLAEIDKYKTCEYSPEDIKMIKDIYFYFG